MLVGIQDICLAAAAGELEKPIDRVVQIAVQDGLEAAFGCVELLCDIYVSIKLSDDKLSWLLTDDKRVKP